MADPIPDPVPGWLRILLGSYFIVLAIVSFSILVVAWPVPRGNSAEFEDFSILVWGPFALPSDLRLFITVIAAGAVGSLIHAFTSFADYAGNRVLAKSWLWWFILRTPIGIALALLFYVVVRGGLIVPSLPNGTETTRLINPYGIAAISALAGMFSKQATDKLREIFDTLFRTQQPVKRADPLTTMSKPVITGTQPNKLSPNGGLLNIQGSGFNPGCVILVNGESREPKEIGDKEVKVEIRPQDVAGQRQLTLIVRNPGPKGIDSDPFIVEVSG